MIPDEVIEQVRDAADLVEVIGESVALKRTGTDYRGACPFHGGTHRNFAVVPKKGLFYCYVCHEAGDVFTWHMKRMGLDYPSAVREVARRVGIPIPEATARAEPDRREPLFSAVAVAQELFARALRESDEANGARDYLERRDVPQQMASEHGLGYAPRGKAFVEAMARLGIPEATLIAAGLMLQRDDGTVAARFRGRLLFPIHDLRGRVVGFGGRLLGPGEPKYLNSPESEIFHKGQMLYHLHTAKNSIRKEDAVILVEGYFDVLRLVQVGIDHVVAPLGTGLTPDQCALLKRYAPTAILLYDSDQAGLRATFRGGDELLRHGVRVRVASAPPGEDPDTLAQKGGRKAVEAILDDAVDLFERKIQVLDRKGWFADLEHRREAIDKLLPTIRAAADPIARDLYLSRLAERAGVSREVLEGELAQSARRYTGSEPRQPSGGASPAATRPNAGPLPRKSRHPMGARTEGRLLAVLAASPGWLARAREELTPAVFEVPAYRAVAEHLFAGADTGPLADMFGDASPRLRDVWARIEGAAEQLAGMDLDAEYLGATERLRQREAFRELAAIKDPSARQLRRAELGIPPEVWAAFRHKERPGGRSFS